MTAGMILCLALLFGGDLQPERVSGLRPAVGATVEDQKRLEFLEAYYAKNEIFLKYHGYR